MTFLEYISAGIAIVALMGFGIAYSYTLWKFGRYIGNFFKKNTKEY